LYEMFLGPIEQSKPWNTNSIDGVVRFLKKLWRMYQNEAGEFYLSDEEPSKEELKVLHKTIKKVEEDIERFSLNTCVSTFMICVNELSALKCNKKAILKDLLILVNPFAPHITKELWSHFWGNKISYAEFPKFNEEYLKDSEFEYPISINGKMRMKMPFPTDTPVSDIQKAVLASENVQKWLEGKEPKKIIIVPNKIVNLVV
jgi:leucyl-tRNA synthetase